MWKLVLAFAAGAASASAMLLLRTPAAQTVPAPDEAPAAASAAHTPQAWGASPFSTAASATSASASESGSGDRCTTAAAASTPPAGSAVASSTKDPPSPAAAPAEERTQATGTKKATARSQFPITDDGARTDLQSGYESIVARDRANPDSISQLHDNFTSQGGHSAWADTAEQNLKAYLAPAAASRGINVTGIDCHETLCEVQALGPSAGSGMGWSNTMRDMANSQADIGVGRWSMINQNGQTYILAFFWKPRSR